MCQDKDQQHPNDPTSIGMPSVVGKTGQLCTMCMFGVNIKHLCQRCGSCKHICHGHNCPRKNLGAGGQHANVVQQP